jgi:hypothetical protein
VKDIGQQRIDITTIKMVMKPVQRAVKDVSKSISDSPLYHAALRPANNNSANTSFGLASPQSLAPPFQGGYQGNFTPAGLNTALAQSMPLNLGPPTSVPATPLTAALGPAAQATLSQPQGDYMSAHNTAGSAAGVRGMHERLDTMIQHPPGSGASYNQYGQQHPQHSNNNSNVNSSSNGNSNYAGFPHTARRVDMNR